MLTSSRRSRPVAIALLAATVTLTACASDGQPQVADPTTPATSPATTDAPSPATATAASTTPSPTPSPLPPLESLALETVADGVDEPVHATAPAGDDRVFVVERTGAIVIAGPDGQVLPDPFLDIRSEVHANSIEQGLLSVAFHPDYASNGRFFVFHSLPSNDNQLVEYRVSDDPDVADASSGRVLLTIDKEADKVRHNGGLLAFGPDGTLFLSVGDGARASVNGQDPTTRLGAILRLDVDAGEPYAIPADNPFADGEGGAAEVWAYGLRNPWRFWIDPVDELVYIGDVGQETVEEINVVSLDAGGVNFGWPIREGDQDFYGGEAEGELTGPLLALDHEATPSCSVTGGIVYRGTAIPELDGTYLFGDWCLGWIRSLRNQDAEAVDVTDLSEELDAQMVSSFGTDGAGEALVVDYAAGTVSRIVPVR